MTERGNGGDLRGTVGRNNNIGSPTLTKRVHAIRGPSGVVSADVLRADNGGQLGDERRWRLVQRAAAAFGCSVSAKRRMRSAPSRNCSIDVA